MARDSRGDIPNTTASTPLASVDERLTSEVTSTLGATPSLTTNQLLTIWRHIEEDDEISLFDHAKAKPPKFCGLFDYNLKFKTAIGSIILTCAEIVIGIELILIALFLLEYFTVSSRMSILSVRTKATVNATVNSTTVNVTIPSPRRSHREVPPWGFTSCPSPNSSLIQTILSLLTVTFALLLILGKVKRNLYLIRIWLVMGLMILIGRLSLAGIWFHCASNVTVIPWTLAGLGFLELARFYHWQTASEANPRTGIPSGAVLVQSAEGNPDLVQVDNPLPTIMITPPPKE